MNKKMTAVIRREYITRAKTKGFIIGTLLFPLIVGLILGGVFIFMVLFKPSTKTYALVDQSGVIGQTFQNMLDDTLSNGEPKHRMILTEMRIPLDSLLANLQNQVRDKKLDGYLVIPPDILETREVIYSARNVSDFEEQGDFSGVLSYIVGNLRLENQGLPADRIRQEMSRSRVRLISRQITDKGEIEKNAASSFILAYILTYMMLLLMMGYGQTLMRSVVEEKTQRITETIIASIRPRDLLLGKMIGISALGLTQLFVVGVIMMLLVQFIQPVLVNLGLQSPGLMAVIKQIHFTVPLFGFMIVFFL
ncbi:MAG TPA: ABC transporter permease, partial [bacterium]|nr:ABC transporter permease [bacterium]